PKSSRRKKIIREINKIEKEQENSRKQRANFFKGSKKIDKLLARLVKKGGKKRKQTQMTNMNKQVISL
ncbi:hypothetical protein V4Y02_23770, partial [Escherichia coli]